MPTLGHKIPPRSSLTRAESGDSGRERRRCVAEDRERDSNPSSGSGAANPRKRKNQRQQPAAAPQAASSLLPKTLSLLADAAGRLQLGAHADARQSLVHTAAELAAFNVLAAVLGISISDLSLLPTS